MKRAVKWMLTASTSVDHLSDRKEQDGRHQPRKVHFHDQLYGKKCSPINWEIVKKNILQNKDPKQALMPKVPQKVKVLKNKKYTIFSKFKIAFFLFCQRRP